MQLLTCNLAEAGMGAAVDESGVKVDHDNASFYCLQGNNTHRPTQTGGQSSQVQWTTVTH